jgi:hypothetical protein
LELRNHTLDGQRSDFEKALAVGGPCWTTWWSRT